MTASQSEPLSPTIALSSLSLAAAVADDHAVGHAPMTPLEPISLDAEAKKARRRSFLPVHAFASAAGGLPPHLAPASVAAAAGTAQEEMDEESLSKHRNRLRALMHYLRDLDDLTAVRTEAASFVGPSKNTLSHLRDGEPLSRTASMHRAESSNPSTKSRDSGGEYVASTAASSISEGASSEPTRLSTARCSKDDSVRRFRIIAEIVSTERTYVRGLSELVDVYVRPAMAPADGNSGVPVIPPMEHRAVFGNVEALLQFHRTVFLPSLLAVTNPILAHDQEAASDLSPDETAAIAEKVAAVFSTHAAFFKMYTSYINNCDSAQARISAWMAPSSAGNGGGLSLRGAPGYSALQAFGALSAQQAQEDQDVHEAMPHAPAAHADQRGELPAAACAAHSTIPLAARGPGQEHRHGATGGRRCARYGAGARYADRVQGQREQAPVGAGSTPAGVAVSHPRTDRGPAGAAPSSPAQGWHSAAQAYGAPHPGLCALEPERVGERRASSRRQRSVVPRLGAGAVGGPSAADHRGPEHGADPVQRRGGAVHGPVARQRRAGAGAAAVGAQADAAGRDPGRRESASGGPLRDPVSGCWLARPSCGVEDGVRPSFLPVIHTLFCTLVCISLPVL
ncbi:hypothetical protein L1887_58685 [Cichorium endivia]|nr:hypothetical protein L1887_58685 [Cichorium endivia]